jgi:hypothetical protein
MQTPTITYADVRGVLRHLSRDCSAGDTPLADLSMVRRSLTDAGFEPTPGAREHEVGRLILEVVGRELAELRHSAGARGNDQIDQLRADFSIGHRDLEAWSALYHLYLRPDLNLSLAEIERLLADRHRRTIQRRLRHGVDLLVTRLIDLERECAGASRRPVTGSVGALSCAIPGMDGTVISVIDALRSRCRPAGVALAGPGGIGKSTIARLVAARLKEQGGVEDVTWIDARAWDADSLASGLHWDGVTVRPEVGGRPGAARRFSSERRTLVAVDGVDRPGLAKLWLKNLAVLPRATAILLTGRIGWQVISGVDVVDVPPLAHDPALALLRRELTSIGLAAGASAEDDVLWPIVAAAAGSPLALRVAAEHLAVADVQQIADDLLGGGGCAAALYRGIWEPAYESCDEAVRATLHAVVDLRSRGALADGPAVAAVTGRGPSPVHEHLSTCVAEGLLTSHGSLQRRHFVPALFLDRYLQVVRCGQRPPISRPPVQPLARSRAA